MNIKRDFHGYGVSSGDTIVSIENGFTVHINKKTVLSEKFDFSGCSIISNNKEVSSAVSTVLRVANFFDHVSARLRASIKCGTISKDLDVVISDIEEVMGDKEFKGLYKK